MESKSLRSPSVACRPQRQAGQHRSPEVALRNTPLAVALPMALPGTADPQVWCPAEHSRRPWEVPQGGGLSLPGGAPAGLMASTPPERPLKLPLEGLQEFLQDTLSRAWALEDDAVLRQLQASMAELRRTKRDLLPSGALSSGLLRSHPLGQ